MKRDELRELADAFVAFQSSPNSAENADLADSQLAGLRSVSTDPPGGAGAWLRRTLGLALTAVGLNFGSGPAASRYLSVIDSQTAADMRGWPAQYARSWIRQNLPSLADPDLGRALVGPENHWAAHNWRQLVGESKIEASFWGPGYMRTTPKLERAMGLFVLGRSVEIDLGSQAAFSCLVAASPQLGRTSIVRHIAANGSRGMEDGIMAVDAYLASR